MSIPIKKIILPVMILIMTDITAQPLFPVHIDGKFGFIDKKGTIRIEAEFEGADYFSEGLASVAIKDKSGKQKAGFVGESGEFLIQPAFEAAGSFSEGLAPVKSGGKYGFIGKDGEFVIEPKFDYAGRFSEGLAVFRIDKKVGYINKDGLAVIRPEFDEGKEFSGGLAAVRINERWGFINKEGKFVLQPLYDYAESFSEGVAAVVQYSWMNKVNRYINKKGDEWIKPERVAQELRSFSEGIAAVRLAEGWGFIDRNGKVVIEPDSNILSAGFFKNGVVQLILADAGNGYMDKSGRYIWKNR